MRQLRPIRLRPKYWRGIEQEIMRLLDQLIYRRLAALFPKDQQPELRNSESALFDAVRDGLVWYEDGHFEGEFNAALTRELRNLGAIWNPKSRTWSLTRENVPADLRTAQAQADLRYDKLRKDFLTTLDDMQIDSIDRHSDTTEQYREAISWMDDDFDKAVRSVSVPPALTDAQRYLLAREYGQNLDLYIKNWASENILELRQKVEANAFTGRRASNLVKMLEENYGVGRRKAQFLARQETSLLMSKFHQNRYQEMGIQRYRWSGADDERERPDHKALNGKVFSFDQPPITNRKTGARNNPGEDFNCRCVAIALVE